MASHQRLFGLLCLLLAVAITGAAVVLAVEHWQPEVAVNADECPSTPRGVTLVCIDQTDVWPRQEQERIASGILSFAEAMRKHERLAIHVITGRAEDTAAPWPVPGFPAGFRLCKPVDSKVDPTVQNERLIRAAYQQKFLGPLTRALPHLVTGATAERSPILQAIEIALWSPHFRADIPSRTLVLYSDFLHHMKDLSQLTQPLSNPCSVLASDIGRRLKARDWQGVKVILEYLRNPRDAERQTPEHQRFWIRLFYLLGAAQVFDGPTAIADTFEPCPVPVAATTNDKAKQHALSPTRPKR